MGGNESAGHLEAENNSCFGCFNFISYRRPKNRSLSSISSLSNGVSSVTFSSQHTLSSETSLSSNSSGSVFSRKGEDVTLSADLKHFSYASLKEITRNFRPDSLLGEGGFGCVYKGWVDENGFGPAKPGTGLAVAVKNLNQKSMQGHKEWLAEVTVLGQLRHPNLVRLVGYGIEDDQRLLVYEYMHKGSLESHLFKSSLALPWNIRMRVILGAARGLEFLHTLKNPIIYRDLKTSNILLDENFEAKLSDFGLARDGPEGEQTHVSTQVMGTYGYAAPEYIMTGHLTFKSDIYSFGVVLLEILTGKKSMDKTRPYGEQNLVPWARPMLSDKKKLLGLVDARLQHQFSVRGALKVGQLCRKCCDEDPKVRPSMRTIRLALEQIQGLEDMAATVLPSKK